jgi:hypothetical protein
MRAAAGSSKRIEKLAICVSMLLGGSDGLAMPPRRSEVRAWNLRKLEPLHTVKQPFFGGGVVGLAADRGEVLAALDSLSHVAVWGRKGYPESGAWRRQWQFARGCWNYVVNVLWKSGMLWHKAWCRHGRDGRRAQRIYLQQLALISSRLMRT